jgi:thiamine kinase-like enzyme
MTERDVSRRLRGLKLGVDVGAFNIEALDGGISNQNFAILSLTDGYVARLSEPRPHLAIDRRNEVACQQAASRLLIAPEVVHHEDGLLVSRYIYGTTLTAGDVRTPAMIVRLSSLLRKLHDGWDQITGQMLYFCPFQTVRTYAATALELGAPIPADLGAILEDTQALSIRVGPFIPVLCHNDLMPANLIIDGARLCLVDWEYSGVGHRLFDLANASANAGFGDDDDRALMISYGYSLEPRELATFRIMKTASFLRESLWGSIQTVASKIKFDYRRYAAENLDAYRQARSRLS